MNLAEELQGMTYADAMEEFQQIKEKLWDAAARKEKSIEIEYKHHYNIQKLRNEGLKVTLNINEGVKFARITWAVD